MGRRVYVQESSMGKLHVCRLMHVNSAAQSVCFEVPPPTFVLITVHSDTDVTRYVNVWGQNAIKMSRYDNKSATSRRYYIYRDKDLEKMQSAFIKQLIVQKTE